VGAALALLGPFGIALSAIGVTCLVVGVIIAAPYAGNPGPFLADWWNVLAIGALICLVGFGIGFLAGVVGGVLITIGAITALVAVGLGADVRPAAGSSSLD